MDSGTRALGVGALKVLFKCWVFGFCYFKEGLFCVSVGTVGVCFVLFEFWDGNRVRIMSGNEQVKPIDIKRKTEGTCLDEITL